MVGENMSVALESPCLERDSSARKGGGGGINGKKEGLDCIFPRFPAADC